ncbi:MAG TPA: hypothetical protein PKA13_21945 [Geminicoccaceae bacterium]|nr:hypothetical protein [Geminicoccus sp.]HMU52457.1 hypothetical protein [Geminicoccaceae bacterium]
MNEYRSLLKPPLSAVVSINGKFLVAALTGFLAWLCWPSSPQWWPLAILSLAMGSIALGALIEALGLIFKIHSREREIAAMLRRGRPQHGADLVRGRALRKARMTDD